MTYAHSKEIDVTLQICKSGVGIFVDVECTALVDYDVEDGEMDWQVTGFEFCDKNGRTTVKKNDGPLFNILMSGLDDRQITDILHDEFSYTHDSDSGFCTGARMMT